MKTWDEILGMHGLMAAYELEWLRDNAAGQCVELGSLEGMSSCAIGYGLASRGGHLTCVDVWPEAYRRAAFLRNTRDLPISSIVSDSVAAASLFETDSLDFIFIDTSHTYDLTMAEVPAWLPKLRSGGWMVGHDYGNDGFPGLMQALLDLQLPIDVVATGMWRHIKP